MAMASMEEEAYRKHHPKSIGISTRHSSRCPGTLEWVIFPTPSTAWRSYLMAQTTALEHPEQRISKNQRLSNRLHIRDKSTKIMGVAGDYVVNKQAKENQDVDQSKLFHSLGIRNAPQCAT
jgi:hypothetical protein